MNFVACLILRRRIGASFAARCRMVGAGSVAESGREKLFPILCILTKHPALFILSTIPLLLFHSGESMFRAFPCVVTALTLAAVACLPSKARTDDFIVIARDLQSQAFVKGTKIELRVFKQVKAAIGTTGAVTAGSTFSRGEMFGNPLIVTTDENDFTAEFKFKIDVNDPLLTGNEEKPDRTILLELRRNGGNTAIVPFIAVGDVNKKTGVVTNIGTQRLNVAVPEPRLDDIICYPMECYGRFRFFRRR